MNQGQKNTSVLTLLFCLITKTSSVSFASVPVNLLHLFSVNREKYHLPFSPVVKVDGCGGGNVGVLDRQLLDEGVGLLVVVVATWRRSLEGHIKDSVGVQLIVPCRQGVATTDYLRQSPGNPPTQRLPASVTGNCGRK